MPARRSHTRSSCQCLPLDLIYVRTPNLESHFSISILKLGDAPAGPPPGYECPKSVLGTLSRPMTTLAWSCHHLLYPHHLARLFVLQNAGNSLLIGCNGKRYHSYPWTHSVSRRLTHPTPSKSQKCLRQSALLGPLQPRECLEADCLWSEPMTTSDTIQDRRWTVSLVSCRPRRTCLTPASPDFLVDSRGFSESKAALLTTTGV